MANKTIKDNRKSSLIQWLVFLSRLIVGGTFVFSGFVKVIDPYGTVYKFQDYFSAFHLDFLSSFAMLFSVALSVIEFVLGVHLLFGSYRKSADLYFSLCDDSCHSLFGNSQSYIRLWLFRGCGSSK